MPRAAPLSRRLVLCVLAALLTAGASIRAGSQRATNPRFPAALEKYLSESVKLTPLERSTLFSNAPVSKLLDGDPAKEVSIFGAVWIDAPASAYVALVRDIENFERGGAFHVTRRISDPPKLSDFDAMTLPDEDVADLKNCRVGDCELKLSQDSLDRVRKSLDWSKPTIKRDADALARQVAFDFVRGYVEGGNDRLGVYRDRERPTFVAAEFRTLIDRVPALVEFLPDFKSYLLGYPKAVLPNASSFLYWQEAQFGLKPTIRVNHLVIQERPDSVAIANKMIYASHYFWTALELRVLVPDPARGRGFWFVNVNRSRSDGLSGFVGRIIRGRVQSEAQRGIATALSATRAALERNR